MKTESELVLAISQYLTLNPKALAEDKNFLDIPDGENRILLYVAPGRNLQLLGLILNSEYGESDIIALFTEIATGELNETFCPDTDVIDWGFTMGISFHGIPERFSLITDHFVPPLKWDISGHAFEILNKSRQSIVTQYFMIQINDYMS